MMKNSIPGEVTNGNQAGYIYHEKNELLFSSGRVSLHTHQDYVLP